MVATFKVRTGCKTCKIRKVKCDEVKPYCKRCTSTGRKCDGYDPFPPPRKTPRRAGQSNKAAPETDRAISTERSVTPSSSLHTSRRTTPEGSSIVPSRWTSPFHSISPEPAFQIDIPLEHQQWIHHFRDFLAPALSGRFENDMWTVLLPQLCHREPAVLYAVASIGAGHSRFMHQHRQQKRARLEAEEFEINNYNKAIATLRSRNNPVNRDLVSVACCLLFTIFECLYGNRSNALIHLRHGLQILDGTAVTRWAEDARQILHRFSTQSVLFGNCPGESSTFWDIVQPTLDLQVPEKYTDLGEAQQQLDVLINAGITFVYKVRHTAWAALESELVNEPHDALIKQMRKWKSAMGPLLQPTKEVSRPASDAKILDLFIRFQASSLWVQSCLRSHETSFDAYRSEFEDIVRCAKKLNDLQDTTVAESSSTTPFTLDHGIVPALFLVAIKCRYPDLRRQAIKVMQELPSREGLWDTKLHVAVARRIAEIEEMSTEALSDGTSDGLPQLPPETCRVYNANIHEDAGFVEIGMRPTGHGKPTLKWREDLDVVVERMEAMSIQRQTQVQ